MLRSLPSLRLSWKEDQKMKSHPLLSSIWMSVANPYWIIWWATIGLGYILYSWQFGD
jgi:threonine/homoserine/homoserine lactone efflux protein